ncbi:Neuferricin [Armadillidium nasatum]|uniref:Neuferricin n=1 Tax=Armadillidium nasatum TaxID=96803 RepID=A0A5N5SVN5_9CRUS|nr:Neuferricin [Armadillidium nasatum]
MEIGSKVYCTSSRIEGFIAEWWNRKGLGRSTLVSFFILGSKRERCACVKNFGKSAIDLKDGEVESDTKTGRGDLDNPNVREYDDCEPDEDFCYLKKFNKT